MIKLHTVLFSSITAATFFLSKSILFKLFDLATSYVGCSLSQTFKFSVVGASVPTQNKLNNLFYLLHFLLK
jgi:hypothetical protein